MEKVRAVLTPGYYAAKRLDKGYARFLERAREKIRPSRRESIWLFGAAPVVEHTLAFILGVVSGLFELTFPMLILILIYPIAGVGDMYLWKSVYGRLAKSVSRFTPLLINLDILYWLSIGYVVSWLLL